MRVAGVNEGNFLLLKADVDESDGTGDDDDHDGDGEGDDESGSHVEGDGGGRRGWGAVSHGDAGEGVAAAVGEEGVDANGRSLTGDDRWGCCLRCVSERQKLIM